MKGAGGLGVGVTPYPLPPKKRWKGLVIAVLGLVVLSMLVPLVFLLGLHNGFRSNLGSVPEKQSTASSGFGRYSQHSSSDVRNQSTQYQSQHMDELMKRLEPGIPKDFLSTKERIVKESGNKASMQHQPTTSPPGQIGQKPISKTDKVKESKPVLTVSEAKVVGDGEISCELNYGSYCLWRREYREDMKDSLVKTLKDRLFVARAFYPSIAKLPDHDKLSREMRQNIQDIERVMSETTVDADLPPLMDKKLQKIDVSISKAKSLVPECNNVEKKFRQLVDLTEDETSFHAKQSAFLYQLAVQTMPKSLHCLSMRLTVEYFRNPILDMDDSVAQKYLDPTLYHYVIFSNNILASTVAINSTVIHAKESRKLVFHILTDKENYFAMKLWFSRNTFKDAAVQILNIEDESYSSEDAASTPHLSLPEEFRVSFQSAKLLPNLPHRTAYMSLFSYSHYMLPEIFHKLDKIVLLEDDVVVQRDLSALWSTNMEGKVNAAAQHCDVTLGLLRSYLGGNNFNGKSCSWMSGLNVVDLVRWRDLNLSGTFRGIIRELIEGGSDGAIASHASLLTFQDQVYPLDGSWVLSGLGHDYGLNVKALSKPAVLHYNGNMKPWLELGIPKFKNHWTKYLHRDDQFLTDCNVNS